MSSTRGRSTTHGDLGRGENAGCEHSDGILFVGDRLKEERDLTGENHPVMLLGRGCVSKEGFLAAIQTGCGPLAKDGLVSADEDQTAQDRDEKHILLEQKPELLAHRPVVYAPCVLSVLPAHCLCVAGVVLILRRLFKGRLYRWLCRARRALTSVSPASRACLP